MPWSSAPSPLALSDPVSADERAARTAELLRVRSAAGTEEERRRINAELVRVNQPVAVAVARRYRNRGVADEDLCQSACEGLVKAVARFDPARSEDLLTFAVPTIRGELQRHFRDSCWAVRPPRRLQETQRRVAHCTDELRQMLGREPRCDELADRLGVTAKEVEEAQRLHECFSTLSLDQPATPGSSATLGEYLPDPDPGAELAEARVALGPCVRRLSERERRILYLRFFEDRSQAEIGQDLGVSQMQVSRLLNQLLGRLRSQLG